MCRNVLRSLRRPRLLIRAGRAWWRVYDAREACARADYATGAAAYGDAIARFRALPHEHTTVTQPLARCHRELAGCYRRAGRYEESVAPAEEAVVRYRAMTARDPAHRPGLGRALNGLAIASGATGDPRRALALAGEALDLLRDVPVDPERLDLVVTYDCLAQACADTGRPAEAVAAIDHAIAVLLATSGVSPMARDGALRLLRERRAGLAG